LWLSLLHRLLVLLPVLPLAEEFLLRLLVLPQVLHWPLDYLWQHCMVQVRLQV
jgi:hypothetical protein